MSPSSLLSPPPAHHWPSHVQCPNPLWTFATFQLWVAPPPASCVATTVYALPPFLPSLCLLFRFVFFAFFDNEKCSTRFSLLIYVLARFSYTLAFICCCCCCCSSCFFLCQFGSLPSFNFTCHGCICSFFLCIAVQFNEHFFMSFQLGAPICLWFHLRNSQMQLQLPVTRMFQALSEECLLWYLWNTRGFIFGLYLQYLQMSRT